MISSLEKNPANGNIPTSASDETIHAPAVIGIFLARPPMSFFMSKLWCEPEWLTEPAHRKRQHLKKAWVKMWNTAGSHAPAPRPSIM